MESMDAGARQLRAQEVLAEGLVSGRALEEILGVEAALQIDSRCPDALIVLADQEEVRRLASAPYVRLALAHLAHDEAWNRVRARQRVMSPPKRDVFDMLEARPYLRSAILLAACLVETGHADLARGIYRRVMRQQPRDSMGARYLLAILDVRSGDDAAFDRRRAQFEGDEHPAWVLTELLVAHRRGDAERMGKALEIARRRYPEIVAMVADIADADRTGALEWRSSELHALWRANPPAQRWLRGVLGETS
jgi:hypothetical protein